MKKFVAGVLVGAVVASAGSALAAQNESISATFAEFNILVNGQKASLSDKPVVIEGSSYLPVRAISNTLGYKVQYDGESRTISLANDGKEYLKTVEPKKQETGKTEDNKQVSNGNFVKDLKGKYSKDGKLDAELIKKAIESKELSVNAQDEASGDSLLILAIKENNFAAYQVLKHNKVDPELANKEGKRPIHVAVIEKNRFFMSELTSYFRVNAKALDNYSKRAIDYTEKNSSIYDSIEPYSN